MGREREKPWQLPRSFLGEKWFGVLFDTYTPPTLSFIHFHSSFILGLSYFIWNFIIKNIPCFLYNF